MIEPRFWVLCGIVALALFGGGYVLGHHDRTLPMTVQYAQQQVVKVRDTVQRIDTLVLTKNKVLTKTLMTYQTIRDTIHDSLPPIHDTMWVKSEVQVCDSLARACRAFQTAAQAKFRADSLLVSAQSQEIAAWKAIRPNRFGLTLDAGYSFSVQHPVARGEMTVGLSDRLRAVGVIAVTDSSNIMRAKQSILLRYTLH